MQNQTITSPATKSAHINDRRAEATSLMQQVCRLLAISEMEYCQYKYKVYCQYIRLMCYNDFHVLRSVIFRKWWNNRWANRDAEFIALGCHPDKARKAYIFTIHHAPTLAQEIEPTTEVLELIENEINDSIKKGGRLMSNFRIVNVPIEQVPAVRKILAEAEASIKEVLGEKARFTVKVKTEGTGLEALQQFITDVTGVSWGKIISKGRHQPVAHARQLYCYACRQVFVNMPLVNIASSINRDHTTVIHSIRTIEDYLCTKHQPTIQLIQQIKSRFL